MVICNVGKPRDHLREDFLLGLKRLHGFLEVTAAQ
ncbi:hypothetical protein Tco_0395414, partial [Tanacetum coccineum]